MTDPVRARRAQAARAAEIGQRLGYGLFGIAAVTFVIGFIVGFGGVTVGLVTGCLIGGSVVLAPAIVVGYAVKAAEREDRERGL